MADEILKGTFLFFLFASDILKEAWLRCFKINNYRNKQVSFVFILICNLLPNI